MKKKCTTAADRRQENGGRLPQPSPALGGLRIFYDVHPLGRTGPMTAADDQISMIDACLFRLTQICIPRSIPTDEPYSSDGDRLQVGFNGLNDFGSQREVRLFGLPVLVKQRHGFTRGIENEFFRQSSLGGKMGQLVF